MENPLIPLTNNMVELVIRRFDQHYQNMCGFDSIETARKYLHLFELTYRFTPFAKDNRPVKGENWTFAANALWNWPAMTSARYPLPASCAGSCWAGRLKSSGSLSHRCNAPWLPLEKQAEKCYNLNVL